MALPCLFMFPVANGPPYACLIGIENPLVYSLDVYNTVIHMEIRPKCYMGKSWESGGILMGNSKKTSMGL